LREYIDIFLHNCKLSDTFFVLPGLKKQERKEMVMKQISVIITVLALSLSVLTFAAEKEKASTEKLKTYSEKLSYVLGSDIGKSLKGLSAEIDLDIFRQGVEDSFKGKKLLLTPQQVIQIQREFSQKIQDERTQEIKALTEKNRKEGEVFLAENKKKKGVTTTASGLQYLILKQGDGPKPKATDRVKVHYRGTLIDGTEFDSSYQRGQPATFAANRVIAGWTEALQLMKVGSKYRLFIPANLAYGERGAGAQIGPNATLIFEVELLAIEK